MLFFDGFNPRPVRFTEPFQLGIAKAGKTVFVCHDYDVAPARDDRLHPLSQPATILIQPAGDFFIDLNRIKASNLTIFLEPLPLSFKITRVGLLSCGNAAVQSCFITRLLDSCLKPLEPQKLRFRIAALAARGTHRLNQTVRLIAEKGAAASACVHSFIGCL